MRCHLHVHTRVRLESYNEPRALYETLKQRGMDLVTVTDHDSIDAAEELRRYPDFFLSEEVTCTMPSGTEMHAGVYGIGEADHTQLQRRRTDIESLLAYAVEHRLFVTVKHVYSILTGSRTEHDYLLKDSNQRAAEFARRFDKPCIGGSDAHTLTCAGRTWTQVRGALTTEEFLTRMRVGHSVPAGESGDYWKLTAAVFGIGKSLIRTRPWMAAFGGRSPEAAL